MEFEATLNQDDFRAFLKSVTEAQRREQSLSTWGWVALVGVISALMLFADFVHWPTVFGTLGGLCLLIWLMARRSRDATMPLEDGAVLGTVRVLLDEEGVHEFRARSAVRLHWDGVRGLRETDDHFFLMVDRIAGAIVPKRCLGPDGTGRLRTLVSDYTSI